MLFGFRIFFFLYWPQGFIMLLVAAIFFCQCYFLNYDLQFNKMH